MGFSRPEYWSGSLSLLQGIFPTQGLNPGLHKGSPRTLEWVAYPLLQGIFPTQGLNPGLHKGSPRILEWVAYPCSSGFSQPGSPALQADSLPTEPPGKPVWQLRGQGGGGDKLTQVRCSEVCRILVVPSLKGELVNAGRVGTSSQW